jgi:hypothetical protein
MRYALLVYNNRKTIDALDESQREAMADGYYAVGDLPGYLSRLRLKDVDTATTVRTEDGKPIVTDGPFADTKEVFGGIFLIDAKNLDDAVEFAAQIPSARLGGCVEIRPVSEDLRNS